MLAFIINNAYKELAVAEIETLANAKVVEANGQYTLNKQWSKKFARLAFTKEIWHIGNGNKKLLCDINKTNKYQDRRAHLLPAPHPAMAHPKVARAMINLSKAKEILDPFCGAGGILIEARFCNIKATGYDIDPVMLNRARINLNHFDLKNIVLKQQDATTFTAHAEAVVTDLPYAKNTKVTAPLINLYAAFLKNLKKNKIKKAVIGFPDKVNYSQLIKNAGFVVQKEFTYYLHKSLSKKIVVIQS